VADTPEVGDEREGREIREAVLDTNILVRFLTEDPPAMAEIADQILRASEERQIRLVLAPLTFAEVVFVLESRYEWGRAEIADGLTALCSAATLLLLEREVIERTLVLYRDLPAVHFADAYTAALAAERGHGAVV
jgi:predicted nucleic acid-binding protein